MESPTQATFMIFVSLADAGIKSTEIRSKIISIGRNESSFFIRYLLLNA